MADQGPWFVRVAHNKVSVGIFACTLRELPDIVNEACDAEACEFRRLPSGGFVFGGEVVLHEVGPEDDVYEHMAGNLTQGWLDVYEDEGTWAPMDVELATAHIIG